MPAEGGRLCRQATWLVEQSSLLMNEFVLLAFVCSSCLFFLFVCLFFLPFFVCSCLCLFEFVLLALTRMKLFKFEFIRKIFKLLRRNKKSLRNIVCCSIVTTTLTILMVLNS